MPMVWNDQADAKLLVAILQTMTGKLDNAAIAKYMGNGCTVSAIQHRIQRIKEKAHSGDSGSGVGSPAGEQTPGTPSPEKKKRGRPAGSKKVTGYKSPAKKVKADGEDEVGGAGAGGAGQGDGGGYAEDADA